MPEPEIGSHFDTMAEDYDKLTLEGQFLTNSLYGAVLARVLAKSGHHPNSVLDLGAGTGLTLEKTLRHTNPQEVVVVDPSEDMLACLRLKYPEGHKKTTVQTIQATAEEYFTGTQTTFDLITAISMFSYLHEPQPFLRGVVDHLEPGGRVILNYDARVLGSLSIGDPEYDITHHVTGEARVVNRYSPGEVHDMFGSNGLRITTSELHAVVARKPEITGGIVVAERQF